MFRNGSNLALMVDWHTHKNTHRKCHFSTYQTGEGKKVKAQMLASVWGSMQHYILQVRVVIAAAFLENSLSVALKVFTTQPLDSISFLGIYSTEAVTQMHENACMSMFIFTLFIIVEKNETT